MKTIDWEDILDNDGDYDSPGDYLDDCIENYLKNGLILGNEEINEIIEYFKMIGVNSQFLDGFYAYCKNISEFSVEDGAMSYLRLLIENFARDEFRVPPPLDPSYIDILEEAGFGIVKDYGNFRIEKDN